MLRAWFQRGVISGQSKPFQYQASRAAISTSSKLFQDEGSFPPSPSSLVRLAQPEWRLLSAGFAALVTGTAAQIAIPIGFSAMVDTAAAGNLLGNLPAIAPSELSSLKQTLSSPVSLASLFVINGLMNAARIQCFAVASARLVVRLRLRLFDQILNQPMAFFDKHRSGGLVSRLSNDVHMMSDAISGETLSNGIRHSLQLLSTSAVMISISPSLSSILLAIGPTVAGAGFFYGRHVKRFSSLVQRSLGLASATAEERFSAIRIVKAFTAEPFESKLYHQYIKDVYNNAIRFGRATSIFNLFTSMVGNASLLSVLAYGSYLIGIGHLSAGQLTAFGLYTIYFGISIVGLSRFWGDFMKGIGSSQQIWGLLNQPAHRNLDRLKSMLVRSKCLGRIEINNVTFRYPARPTAHVLDCVTLKFEPNTVTALVGASGSGKSTISWLLLKFYEPESGFICLDGVPIEDIDTTWLRQQISIVSQDSAIFHGSVSENLRYGAQQATIQQIEDAARTARAHEFIEKLPHQYDTIIGQNGLDLSGGQRQRIAIARAILKNAPILIFDEATSALDSQNERLINDSLGTVLKSRTTVLIAHRLSTIQKADVIGVLDQGKVVEYGTHSELLQKRGVYYDLIQHQAMK